MVREIYHCPPPLGAIELNTDDHGCVVRVGYQGTSGAHGGRSDVLRLTGGGEGAVSPAQQLEEYLAGDRRSFDLDLVLEGTPFQLSVWQAIAEIPYGTTASYADIARRIGRPRATRAVGGACGLNPVSIMVPCHRVVGSRGALTGYGGGLARKRWLLRHEGVPGFS